MFWFRLINFPVFNVADSCITVSTILLVITWWRDAIKHPTPTSAPAGPIAAQDPETPRPEAE
jgi:signal peptidase II